MKLVGVWLAIVCLLCLLIGCANNDWSYRLEGTGEHWRAILDIVPITEDEKRDSLGDVAYIGMVEKIKDFDVESITYDAVINNSNPGGKESGKNFTKNKIVRIFIDVPSTETEAEAFKKDLSRQELQEILYNVSFTINWKDDTGDHSETITLDVLE
ncbi:hypothetical protein LOK74_23490 [Brevibacillus humidisoli]|uniref:hypothetical protein n=1 Tax=Brevibacillus humidisoli TaxID=2895522 RepID=UPI001E47BE0B|nr:hypothetical protein [Brevibacillus humidisoli]UFJ40914.1 hypothetical protein LOK74_23490 [Brevibacillus humidisoli]